MNPRSHWLLFFVVINIAASLIMYIDGELIGDVAGIGISNNVDIIVALSLVIFTYFIILGPVFNYISKIEIKKINYNVSESILGVRIGIVIFLLQCLFIAFNYSTGVNMAGSNNNKTDSAFNIFWVLCPIDSIFIIYYGMYRDSKFFFINLGVWILSNLLRGWTGIFFAIVFFEWCRAIRKKNLSVFKILFFGVIIIISYPLILNLKWIIRASASSSFSIDTLIAGFINIFDEIDYFLMIGNGLTALIGRLQTTSMVIDVMRLSDLLQTKFSGDDFAPFWKEGLHGIAFNSLLGWEKQKYIGVAFTMYENFNFNYNVGDWNVSLGYPSWFFIAPMLIPIYIIYTIFLGSISFYFLKKLNITSSSVDMLWYIWLVYLMAPWFSQFVVFIYALFLFLLVKLTITVFSNINKRKL